MISIKIYWQDLTPKMQEKLLAIFGDNMNWDCFPMAEIEIESEEDIAIESFLGDK